MPVAALAATLMLALPAADAAAGVSSPQHRDPGAGSPGEAGAGEAQGSVQFAHLGGQVPASRTPKQLAAVSKGPQLAGVGPVATGKPGGKPRVTGPVPRAAQPAAARLSQPAAARLAQPSRPAARHQASRAAPMPARADVDLPMPMVITPTLPPATAQGVAHHGPAHHPQAHHAVARAPHQVGVASYYSRRFNGRLMANGQRFDPHSDSIAHRSLPFGTRVRIVNMTNGRAVMGTVRDRGPFTRGRLLDVSPRIAGELGMIHSGIARVAVWHGRDAVELAEAP